MHPESIALSLSISFDGIAFSRLWQFTDPLTGGTFTTPLNVPIEKVNERLLEIRRTLPLL